MGKSGPFSWNVVVSRVSAPMSSVVMHINTPFAKLSLGCPSDFRSLLTLLAHNMGRRPKYFTHAERVAAKRTQHAKYAQSNR